MGLLRGEEQAVILYLDQSLLSGVAVVRAAKPVWLAWPVLPGDQVVALLPLINSRNPVVRVRLGRVTMVEVSRAQDGAVAVAAAPVPRVRMDLQISAVTEE